MRRARGSLAAGFSALRSGKALVLLLTGATVGLSLLAAAPLGPSLRDALAGTLAGDHILNNHPTFAPTDFFDFLREKSPAIAGARAWATWAAVIALLQQIVFAGGLVSVLGKSAPVLLADFLAGAGRNLRHNLKCFLLFLLAAVLALAVWFSATHAVYRKLFEDLAPGSWSTFFFRVATVLGAFFLYAVLSLLHDFARAARRSDATIGAWRAYGHARRTLSGRWPRALGIFLFWLLVGTAALLFAIGFEWGAPAVSSVAIGIHVLLQIAVLSIRPALRVAAWGSYLALYDAAQMRPPG